ncbi:MAG: MotA/TolQ/ExbB proton channel family protein [Spirochaetia bacterium]|nr:MotA/TolQ/ExbB proton channel family protein [Spirochaetia bacterium]
MSENFTWSHLFVAGGPTLIVLIVCSVISITVIVERVLYFRGKSDGGSELLTRLGSMLSSGDTNGAVQVASAEKTPVAYVVRECIPVAGDEKLFEEVKSRAIAEKIPEMERFLNIEATLGTVSPFIGLLGTVIGIIRAFLSLGGGASRSGNMEGLNAGIAEALVATAAGLFVAIPATMAYNYFRRKVSGIVLQMEIAASRIREAALRR